MQSASNDDLRLVELHFDSLREMRSILGNHVSSEGLFLAGEISFDVSELLRIRAVLPEDFVLFEAVGVVLWVDRLPREDGNGPLGTAVRWVTLDERGRTVVEDLVGGIQGQHGPAFELTPHDDHGEQMPSDAFDATPATSGPESGPNPTRFKFMVRGTSGESDPADAASDPAAWTPPVASPVDGFDPDAAEGPPPAASASVLEPEADGMDFDETGLEWIEPDSNPLPLGSSTEGASALGDPTDPVNHTAPVLPEIDEPLGASDAGDEVSTGDEARQLEEAARALDEAATSQESIPPAWSSPMDVTEPIARPGAGEVDAARPVWNPAERVEAAPAPPETTVPMAIPIAEPQDIKSVFDGLDQAPSEALPATGEGDPTPPKRWGRLGLLLGLLALVLIAGGGWYWWDSQGGRTGIAAIDRLWGAGSTEPADIDPEGVPGLPGEDQPLVDVSSADPAAANTVVVEATTMPAESSQAATAPSEGALQVTDTPAVSQPGPASTVDAEAVDDIRLQFLADGVDVVITPRGGTLAPERIRTENLRQPRRVLIRILGIRDLYRPFEIPVGRDQVERIRVGFHPELPGQELWVVVDLAPASELIVSGIATNGGDLRIALRAE
jgi:hypothetical protein